MDANEEVTEDMINTLAFPEGLAEDAMMVPVDMRGAGEDFEDVQQMLDNLGAKGAANVFLKARAFFQENKDKVAEEERAQPMTAKEWREVLEQEDAMAMEGEEEELVYGEDDEEEIFDEEEGDPEEEGDGEAEEPAAKKAKTD